MSEARLVHEIVSAYRDLLFEKPLDHWKTLPLLWLLVVLCRLVRDVPDLYEDQTRLADIDSRDPGKTPQ